MNARLFPPIALRNRFEIAFRDLDARTIYLWAEVDEANESFRREVKRIYLSATKNLINLSILPRADQVDRPIITDHEELSLREYLALSSYMQVTSILRTALQIPWVYDSS